MNLEIEDSLEEKEVENGSGPLKTKQNKGVSWIHH